MLERATATWDACCGSEDGEPWHVARVKALIQKMFHGRWYDKSYISHQHDLPARITYMEPEAMGS